MAQIKLVYFDFRGRGEPARLVLAAAGQEWEDVRIPREQWPAIKPTTPYGSVPYMEYYGKTYGQSLAIAAFLAREFGLYGRTNVDGLRISEVCNLVEDFIQLFVKANFEKDEEKKAQLAVKLDNEDTPRFLAYFERLLKDNGSKGYFVGNSLSLADLSVFDLTETFIKKSSECLAPFPEISKLRCKVSEHPKLKEYLANRKDTAI